LPKFTFIAKPALRIAVAILVSLSFYQGYSQLSSIEVLAGTAGINDPYYRTNGTGEVCLRLTQKIGWYFNGHLAVGVNQTYFSLAPTLSNDYTDIKNKYNLLQIGASFNVLSAIRTAKQGGRSAIGAVRISCKGFKWYVMAGYEYLSLKETPDKKSAKSVSNFWAGTGFDIIRIGRGARTKYPALVPFCEFKYYKLLSGTYYSFEKTNVAFNKIGACFGIRFTFGLPEQ